MRGKEASPVSRKVYTPAQVRAMRKLMIPVWRSNAIRALESMANRQADLFIKAQMRFEEGKSTLAQDQQIETIERKAHRLLPEELRGNFVQPPIGNYEELPLHRATDKYAIVRMAERHGVEAARPIQQYLGYMNSDVLNAMLAKMEAAGGQKTVRVKASRGRKAYKRAKARR